MLSISCTFECLLPEVTGGGTFYRPLSSDWSTASQLRFGWASRLHLIQIFVWHLGHCGFFFDVTLITTEHLGLGHQRRLGFFWISRLRKKRSYFSNVAWFTNPLICSVLRTSPQCGHPMPSILKFNIYLTATIIPLPAGNNSYRSYKHRVELRSNGPFIGPCS